MKQILIFFIPLSILLISDKAFSQCSDLNIQLQADIPSVCNSMTMTMHQDNIGRPYLYIARKEGGLWIYDITSLTNPKLVSTTSWINFDIMNLTQDGNYLYLAMGNIFASGQNPGMAIVDVTDPLHSNVIGFYTYPAPDGGAGIVRVEGNYAYLGAMFHGLVVLDISDKHNIKYVSEILPDRNFPEAKPDTAKYNARGMEVKNGIVYLCYDAGGFRIIDATDKQKPVEIGRYSNPAMNGRPRAYNNIILDDSLAYIAVDYCGMEILNVADPAHIKLVSWWNPWNCTGPVNNWFNSDGHANEIDFNKQCKKIFLSTGKSDMYVVDVTNPSLPDSCANYGGVLNNIGTWGVSTYQDRIYLSYICSVIPFASNWTGVKILTYTPCLSGVPQKETSSEEIYIFPVPSGNNISIDAHNTFSDLQNIRLSVCDVLGNGVKVQGLFFQESISLDISDLSPGIYFLRVSGEGKKFTKKFVKE